MALRRKKLIDVKEARLYGSVAKTAKSGRIFGCQYRIA